MDKKLRLPIDPNPGTRQPAANAHEIIADAVRSILAAIGEDPDREGLQDTPDRVARMYKEVFQGLHEDPEAHLQTQFTADQHEDIVVVKDIAFHSMCEHHLLPFFGKAHVAYLPQDGRLAGPSKLARIVETLARRPQLQERLSSQIAQTMETAMSPRGVLVVIEAAHMCMAMRGIKSPNATTVTVVSRGVLRLDSNLRSETYNLLMG